MIKLSWVIGCLVVVDVKMLFEVAAKIVALTVSIDAEIALVNSVVWLAIVSGDVFVIGRLEAVEADCIEVEMFVWFDEVVWVVIALVELPVAVAKIVLFVRIRDTWELWLVGEVILVLSVVTLGVWVPFELFKMGIWKDIIVITAKSHL